MFSFIASIFGYLLKWLYDLVGQNYGIALILFTIVLRVILLPITIKQQQSVKKTAKMQSKMQEIQFKYKNNPEQMNKEIMDLYKKENLSPFSGCISAIVQIIIILSVFWLVSKPLTYMNRVGSDVIEGYKNEIIQEDGSISNYYEIEIIQKKSQNDENIKINMDFLGLDLSKVPSKNLNDFKVYIIPVLYVISSILSIKLTTGNKKSEDGKQSGNEQDMAQQMNKSMSYIMPIMAVSIAFVAPLGLALYWFISNALMIIERILINKFVESKEEK